MFVHVKAGDGQYHYTHVEECDLDKTTKFDVFEERKRRIADFWIYDAPPIVQTVFDESFNDFLVRVKLYRPNSYGALRVRNENKSACAFFKIVVYGGRASTPTRKFDKLLSLVYDGKARSDGINEGCSIVRLSSRENDPQSDATIFFPHTKSIDNMYTLKPIITTSDLAARPTSSALKRFYHSTHC